MPDPPIPVEVCLDPAAPPSNLVEALAALILERARKTVAVRATASSESSRKYHEPSAGTARGGER
jgi:hypothetical protein